MSFDKSKAMRNAERYVAQGKIRAAIAEYRAVVDNDPRDVATLNMLGDLHTKNSEKREAIDCYMKVAEHYNTQGFAQKAIAIYNKISRLQPDSIEVSTKLAELYTIKGSLNEARAHYTTLAEHYEKHGRRLEALAMWKQIALLDPNNTEVCLSLAESYLREGQRDDAAEAFAEAGARLVRKGSHEEAIRAMMKGHDIRPNDLRILSGLVNAHSAIGRVGKAVSLLEEILENEPYNRDVLYLLIDCHIDSNNASGAEKAVIKLVELEPANYPKLLDLIRIYLNTNDLDSAARILSMSSEYLLAAGQGDECKRWINEILDRDAFHVAALRLLVRYASWVKEEESFRIALDRLAKAANRSAEVEDERFALAHLVVIRPFETAYSDRLSEINEQYGFTDQIVDEELLKAQFVDDSVVTEVVVPDEIGDIDQVASDNGGSANEPRDAEAETTEVEGDANVEDLPMAAESKLQKELDSITFYIENDYAELAEKALKELENQFGKRREIDQLRTRLTVDSDIPALVEARSLGIEEIRSEFGLEENDLPTDDDFETHYHTAIAYQEMGLTEQAIAEFQDAIGLVSPSDGTRRFFQCANLLGHCFMQNSMANHAVTWFNRALETAELKDDEKQGLWYELAMAYEAEGAIESAALYFEQIYAENVDFRDVAVRVKNMLVTH
ncbi:MAG: tetratricopeptide repeat protein [Acidobacteria bacterium]|nr:tetratricopeptide repeat protein [Acidobacteriota bacterium]